MKKRGNLMRLILISVVVVLIIFFGIVAVMKIRAASCRARLVLFEKRMRDSVENTYNEIGSVSEKNMEVPCGVDEVYFVDLDKNATRLNKSLTTFPLLRDAIESDAEKNAFMVKNEEVVDSFYIGDIDLKKPYYVCSETSNHYLGLYLGGKAGSAELVNQECAFDCTFEAIEVSDEDVEEILNEAKGKCDGCPEGELTDEMELYKETKNFVRIARRCNCGRNPGEAVVEISLKPEGKIKEFKLIERIPKAYVEDLDNYDPIVEGGDNVKVILDPLIMWHFTDLKEETIVRYTLNADVFEYCADVLQTIGYGFPVKSDLDIDDYEDTLSPFVEDDPFQFEFPDVDLELRLGNSENNVFKVPIWHFVSDPDEKSRSVFKRYSYRISTDREGGYSDSATYSPNKRENDYVRCSIDDSETSSSDKVSCEMGLGFGEEYASFYIEASYKGESVIGSFNVTRFNCEGMARGACEGDPDCEWCEECEGKKWSGGESRCVSKWLCSSYHTCDIGRCGADCDSTTNCYDGCYDGNNYYECGGMGCGDDCTCLDLPGSPPDGCSATADEDGDGYQVGCDCLDDASDPKAANINPGSSNPYCDCNSATGGGSTVGTAETCDDSGDDKDCDGCPDTDDPDCGGKCGLPVRVHCRGDYRSPICTKKRHVPLYCGPDYMDGTEGWVLFRRGHDCKRKRYNPICRYDHWTECSTDPVPCPPRTTNISEVPCDVVGE